MDPSFFGSPIATTPETKEVNINGTTNILMSLTNKSPIHFEVSARSPKINPIMIPKTRAIITLPQSFKSVFDPR